MRFKLTLCVIVALVGHTLFLYGFFSVPHSATIVGREQRPSLPVHLQNSSHFSKLVLVIVDALRYDFPRVNFSTLVAERKLDFVQVRAVSRPPTVTLPRIKALISGTVPSYLDVVFNLMSSESSEDNWIDALRVFTAKTIVFYGDDTWLKVLPNSFHRFEGTSSFFVEDFYEVDENVTRHLSNEFGDGLNSWDVMILHYLGLDHVGHVHGPFHHLIGKKLSEMADVLSTITSSLDTSTEDYVVVVCGDHGMADAGGHGGSSSPETNVPVLLFSNRIRKTKIFHSTSVEQADIATTISYLFGVPSPSKSIGIPIKEFFDALNVSFLPFIEHNRLQLERLSGVSIEDPTDWDKLKDVQQQLATRCSHNLPLMVVAWLIFFGVVVVLARKNECVFLAAVLHGTLLCSSSFVEEEQYIWFSCVCLLLSYLCVISLQLRNSKSLLLCVILMLLVRLSWSYNRTGIKWSYLADIADYLTDLRLDYPYFTLLIDVVSVVLSSALFQLAFFRSFSFKWNNLVALILALLQCYYRYVFVWSRPIWEARCVQAIILILFVYAVKRRSLRYLFWSWHELAILLCQVRNVPFHAINVVCLCLSTKLWKELQRQATIDLSTVYVLFYFACGWFSFYSAGNSNSLATVDLPPAYTGLDDYRPSLVGFQLFCSTYIYPVLWFLGLMEGCRVGPMGFAQFVLWTYALLTIGPIAVYLVNVTILRHHLFVWSVFSPKLLYQTMNLCLLFVQLSISFHFVK